MKLGKSVWCSPRHSVSRFLSESTDQSVVDSVYQNISDKIFRTIPTVDGFR